MLGETPLHNFSDYLKKNEIKDQVLYPMERSNEARFRLSKTLIAKERKIVDMASEANDEGTVFS